MNVLVVDDNEFVADSLAFLLDCYGHSVVVAYNGKTALKLLRTGAFDVTFLDESLPDIKGSGVALSLKETPLRPRPYLVSMTGDADSEGDIAQLFDVCLQKPFPSEMLMQVIEDARRSSVANTLQAA